MQNNRTDLFHNPLPIVEIRNVVAGAFQKWWKPYSKGRPCDGFVLILAGSCRYNFQDGSSFVARKGDGIFLAESSVYNIDVLEYYSFIYCDFRFLRGEAGELRKSVCVSFPDFGEAEKCFRLLRNAWESATPERFQICFSILYRIYAQLARSVGGVYVSPSARARLEKAMTFLRDQAHDPSLDVNTLARRAGMSMAYFRKLFTEVYGIPPVRCIVSVRVARARDLLLSDSMTVRQISLACGFSSAPYFCKVFKSHVGVTPSKYKEEMRT